MTQSHGEMREVYPSQGDIYRYTLNDRQGTFTFTLEGETPADPHDSITLSIDSHQAGEAVCRTDSGRNYPFAWAWVGPDLHLWLDGSLYIFQRPPTRRRGSAPTTASGAAILAPMPGIVLEVRVQEGDRVNQGQTLALIESMKMELAITAPRSGIVRRLAVHPGQQVDRGALLFELTPPSDEAG